MSNKIDSRTRNWACVVYPESAPDNWLDIISDEHVSVFISPLHENDIDPQNQPKKPHYHILVMYEGVKSSEQVKTFFDSFGGVGLEKVNSIRGYARYLCHLDNPEKAQYSIDLVRSFGGADYYNIIGLPTDKYIVIGEIIDFCEVNDIFSYYDLIRYARSERFDWFRVLCDSGTYVVKEYLKSRSWTHSN